MQKRRNLTLCKRSVTDDYEIPDDLDFATIWKVYSLNKTKNCRDNPYCLNRLGLEKWDKLLHNISDDNKINSNLEKRDVNKIPCGLVNLGNSCYVNSFLQIFFNDPVFRKCVYSWRSANDFVKPEMDKIDIQELMLCLQKLFITLQITPYEDASAEALVNLLKLDGNQHDALEFQILFFDKLEKLLYYREEWREIRETIIKRYKGVITQTIMCICGRRSLIELPFNPFYLSIEKVKSLSKALQNYLLPEQLPDFKCCECGNVGTTKSCLAIKEPPPVLTIQLNRFTYDSTGQKKKIRSALQYPRVLNLEGVKYDLCAVMIHEGPNADCGHYYDLIKHPGTGQWFTYNDETVKPSAVPGVCTEKERISKVTADMKGCYALVYRQHGEAGIEIPAVPEHFANEIAAKLDDDFLARTCASTEMSLRRKTLVTTHYNQLKQLFDELQVKSGERSIANPLDICFLPTELLAKVVSKEYTTVTLANNEHIDGDNSSDNSSRTITDIAGGDFQSIHFDAKNQYTSLFSLCTHRRVPFASVRNGLVKAVMRIAAERFLQVYGVQFTDLKTGADICLQCVANLKQHSEFVKHVQEKERFVKQLLREKRKRYFHSENCFWVSVKSLSQYKQLAIRCRDQSQNPHASGITLQYTISNNCSSKECDNHISGCVPSTFDIMEVTENESTNTKAFDECLPDDFIPSATVANKAINVQMASIAEDAMDDKDSVSNSEGRKRKLLHDDMETDSTHSEMCCSNTQISGVSESYNSRPQKLSVIDEDVHSARESSTSPPDIISVPDMDEKNMEINETLKMELATADDKLEDSCSLAEQSTQKSNSAPDDDAQSVDEDGGRNLLTVFNGDLRCEHGKFDYESWVTNERRIVVDEFEWDSLVKGVFDVSHYWCVDVDQLPCSLCQEGYKDRIDDCEEMQKRLKEVRTLIGDLVRSIERRSSASQSSQNKSFERVICRNFCKNLSLQFKRRTRYPKIPDICQDCILCEEHKLPYAALNSESLAVPLTLDEWQCIINALQCNPNSVKEIEMKNGAYKSFCNSCYEQQQQQIEHQRFVYEDGAEIFVKLKNDANDEPIKTTNNNFMSTVSSSSSSTARPERYATTRRALAKSSMVFKMASSNTIHELKLKIYQRIGQLPSDQLIYMKERLLNDSDTFEEARVDPHDLIETPLNLIVQQPSEIPCEPRQLERGFADTLLSYS